MNLRFNTGQSSNFAYTPINEIQIQHKLEWGYLGEV